MTEEADRYLERMGEMHRFVGQALHNWAMFDGLLFRVFMTVLGTNKDIAGAIFFRMHGTPTRLELVSDVLNLSPPHAMYIRQWNLLKSKVEPILKVRDLLAHNTVSRRRTIRVGQLSDDAEPIEHLVDEMIDIRLHTADVVNAKKKLPPHDITQLEQHAKDVADLLRELIEFARLLGALPRKQS